MLLALVVGDRQLDGLVGLLDRDLAADLGDLRQALRLARLEELDDTRQTLGDIQAGDTALWKVRMVSWVPGSPIDCAAMIPTASPISTGNPVAGMTP